MWSDALAQVQGGSPAMDPAIGTFVQFGPIILVFIIMYFLLIRPQQQRQKALQKMIDGLKKGDRVLTSGGIFGTVVGVDGTKAVPKIADDIKVEFSKGSIVQVLAGDAK
jgi:preprotein translocase subunit YajC